MKKDKLDFKIPAIRIHQRERKNQAIYLGKVKAKEFGIRTKERFKIDYYERIPQKKDKGYQRQLSDGAVEGIKEFILQETRNPLLPTAMLANSRAPLDFKESSPGVGTLHIKNVLYIIDGQHRFEAWKSMMETSPLRDEWGDYEFPIIILSNFKEYQEIEQFYVINSRQKKIKTDLAQRHLLELAKYDATSKLVPQRAYWQLYATKIVDILNEQIDNAWKGKIILPDDGKDLRRAKIISQNSFVSSLKPFFTGKGVTVFNIKDKIPDGSKLEEWARFLARFWDIVAKVYPEAVENPQDYSIMKTVGVFSLHLFFQRELSRPGSGDENEVFERIENLLKQASMEDFSLSFWRSTVPIYVKEQGKYAGGYSSSAGHNRIAAGLMTGKLI